jgi:toluene monooxygenase system ferredoxin subunit
MERWVLAGTLEDLWEGDMRSVLLGGREILLCNLEGAVVAYDNSCPHLGNPLSKGRLDAHVLTCAAHEWSFDIRTGGGINPEGGCLHRYPVRLDGDRVLIDVNAASNE